jgi:hypothetical protein
MRSPCGHEALATDVRTPSLALPPVSSWWPCAAHLSAHVIPPSNCTGGPRLLSAAFEAEKWVQAEWCPRRFWVYGTCNCCAVTVQRTLPLGPAQHPSCIIVLPCRAIGAQGWSSAVSRYLTLFSVGRLDVASVPDAMHSPARTPRLQHANIAPPLLLHTRASEQDGCTQRSQHHAVFLTPGASCGRVSG